MVKKTRVLIVDDSSTIRRILAAVLSADPDIEVVGSAPEPAIARQMIKDLNPDVLTLDVEMPNMNGMDFVGWPSFLAYEHQQLHPGFCGSSVQLVRWADANCAEMGRTAGFCAHLHERVKLTYMFALNDWRRRRDSNSR